MITSFDIHNFRCFKHLHEKGLKRFTFIVGEGGSGKTALLEALFLACGGNPEIYFRLRQWRGFGVSAEITGTRASYEAVFRDIFYNFDSTAGASIRLEESDSGYRNVEISYGHTGTVDLPLTALTVSSEDAFTVSPIMFRWQTPKKITESTVEVRGGVFQMVGAQEVYPMTFISTRTMDARQNAMRYSDLSKRNQESPVLEALKEVFPEVQALSLETIAGEPMLHASVSGIPEKVPIVVLSGGMNKYLSVVLAILTVSKGAVLIDEIENAFYYRSLPIMLASIVSLCQRASTQLIASTHSYEFLQAVAGIMKDNDKLEDHTALLRLERDLPNGQPKLRMIEGSNYRAAIESDFEVR